MIDSILGKYLTEGKKGLKAGVDITGNKKSLASAFGELSKEIGASKEKDVSVIKKKVMDILDNQELNASDEVRYKNKQILASKKDLFSLLAWINNVYLKGSSNVVIGSKKF